MLNATTLTSTTTLTKFVEAIEPKTMCANRRQTCQAQTKFIHCIKGFISLLGQTTEAESLSKLWWFSTLKPFSRAKRSCLKGL